MLNICETLKSLILHQWGIHVWDSPVLTVIISLYLWLIYHWFQNLNPIFKFLVSVVLFWICWLFFCLSKQFHSLFPADFKCVYWISLSAFIEYICVFGNRLCLEASKDDCTMIPVPQTLQNHKWEWKKWWVAAKICNHVKCLVSRVCGGLEESYMNLARSNTIRVWACP